jgi:hypothetical protein
MARVYGTRFNTHICPRPSLINPAFQGDLRNSSLGDCSDPRMTDWRNGFNATRLLCANSLACTHRVVLYERIWQPRFFGIMEKKLMTVSLRIPNSKSVGLPKKILYRSDKMRRVNTTVSSSRLCFDFLFREIFNEQAGCLLKIGGQ